MLNSATLFAMWSQVLSRPDMRNHYSIDDVGVCNSPRYMPQTEMTLVTQADNKLGSVI